MNISRTFTWSKSITSSSVDLSHGTAVKFSLDGLKIYTAFDYGGVSNNCMISILTSLTGTLAAAYDIPVLGTIATDAIQEISKDVLLVGIKNSQNFWYLTKLDFSASPPSAKIFSSIGTDF